MSQYSHKHKKAAKEKKRLRKPNHLQARCGPRGLPKARADPQRAGGLVWPTHKPATTLDHSPLDPSPGYTGITLYLSLSDASPLCLTSAAFAARAFRGPRAAACIIFLLAGCGWGGGRGHTTPTAPTQTQKKKCRGAHGSIRNRLPHPPDRSRTVQPTPPAHPNRPPATIPTPPYPPPPPHQKWVGGGEGGGRGRTTPTASPPTMSGPRPPPSNPPIGRGLGGEGGICQSVSAFANRTTHKFGFPATATRRPRHVRHQPHPHRPPPPRGPMEGGKMPPRGAPWKMGGLSQNVFEPKDG